MTRDLTPVERAELISSICDADSEDIVGVASDLARGFGLGTGAEEILRQALRTAYSLGFHEGRKGAG